MLVTDAQIHIWEVERPDRPWPKDGRSTPHKPNGFTAEQIRNIREAYRVVYRLDLKLDDAIAQLAPLVAEQPEIKPFVDSLRDGSRGLAR